MTLPEDFLRFIAPQADRLAELRSLLSRRGLAYRLLVLGERRHLLLRLGSGSPRFILSAHYDRVPPSPGFLDNSAACLELADFAARAIAKVGDARGSGELGSAGLFLLFTDGEEEPARGGPLSQGSYRLALALKAALGPRLIGALRGILVFDVTGRGGRLLLSRAPGELLARHELEGGELSRRLSSLEGLCRSAAGRAGLAEPLGLALPWSDDLGFLLGGLPALSVSLLPEAEATAYEGLCAKRAAAGLSGAPAKEEAGAAWPPTWALLHGPEDGPGLADESSFALMASFLDSLLA